MVATLRGESPMPSKEPAAPAAAAEPAASASSELSQQEAEWVMEAKDLKMTAFSVRVTLKENCLLKAARAYMAVNRLEELGNLFKTEPSVEGLENEQFDLDFMVYLASSESAEDIKKAVEKISDIASADVEEIKAAPAPAPVAEVAAAAPTPAAAPAAAPTSAPAPATPAPSAAPAPAAAAPAGAAAQKKESAAKKASQTVRVDIGRLDKLMNLVGCLLYTSDAADEL